LVLTSVSSPTFRGYGGASDDINLTSGNLSTPFSWFQAIGFGAAVTQCSQSLKLITISKPANRQPGTVNPEPVSGYYEINNYGGEAVKVLLTNDDGIHAPGLRALSQELRGSFELDIVAPESEMSAVGHAITLTSPLRVQRVHKNGAFFGYGVTGTPADCVKIAVQELLERPPDIIFSGINLGANVGVNVLYSGTVSAATEGAFLGIRSVALSLDTLQNPDFRFAARFSREIIRFIMEHGLREGTALNVNIPAVAPEDINGISITRQGVCRFRERFDRRIDPRGQSYYWLSGETPVEEELPDADARALRDNRITITPIHYDLTCMEEMERLRTCSLPEYRHLEMGKG
jgi:5'-nucleotidase